MAERNLNKGHYKIPNTVPVVGAIKSIEIQLHWRDGITQGYKGFDDVHQFADFLKQNPALAKAIGYVSKQS